MSRLLPRHSGTNARRFFSKPGMRRSLPRRLESVEEQTAPGFASRSVTNARHWREASCRLRPVRQRGKHALRGVWRHARDPGIVADLARNLALQTGFRSDMLLLAVH